MDGQINVIWKKMKVTHPSDYSLRTNDPILTVGKSCRRFFRHISFISQTVFRHISFKYLPLFPVETELVSC